MLGKARNSMTHIGKKWQWLKRICLDLHNLYKCDVFFCSWNYLSFSFGRCDTAVWFSVYFSPTGLEGKKKKYNVRESKRGARANSCTHNHFLDFFAFFETWAFFPPILGFFTVVLPFFFTTPFIKTSIKLVNKLSNIIMSVWRNKQTFSSKTSTRYRVVAIVGLGQPKTRNPFQSTFFLITPFQPTFPAYFGPD